ncbi:MAG: substrate-binding domain-containing protein [Lachnospiraceae bacterium]|nr:substrate-binding domain-containing protein [Lachnospiraceae bacterium]
MKKIIALSLMLLLIVACIGCGSGKAGHKDSEGSDEPIDISEKTSEQYAIITKSGNNDYNLRMAQGFQEVLEDSGKGCVVYHPENGLVTEQIEFVEKLIKDKAACIAIAPVDAEALEPVLKKALEAKICVCSFDAPATPDGRMLDISECEGGQMSAMLLDEILEISEGEGSFAIVSSFLTSSNQKVWISEIEELLQSDSRYSDLTLVNTAYGDDDYRKSYDQTISLLKTDPDIKVICGLSTIAMQGAAQALRDTGSSVKLTGLGLPSEMAEYVGAEKEVPAFFMWNPIHLGRVTAYVSMALRTGLVDGEDGEQFKVEDNIFTVTKSADDGTMVIVGEPLRFDSENIEEWKDVF